MLDTDCIFLQLQNAEHFLLENRFFSRGFYRIAVIRFYSAISEKKRDSYSG